VAAEDVALGENVARDAVWTRCVLGASKRQARKVGGLHGAQEIVAQFGVQALLLSLGIALADPLVLERPAQ
jgi:hypothetical protein